MKMIQRWSRRENAVAESGARNDSRKTTNSRTKSSSTRGETGLAAEELQGDKKQPTHRLKTCLTVLIFKAKSM